MTIAQDEDAHTSTNHEQAYSNYDLRAVATEADKRTVKFAFEFPELLTMFEAADEAAGKGRDRNRRLGYLGIVLVLIALLYAATVPLLEGWPEETRALASYVATGAGLIGTAFGVVAFMLKSQRGWLKNRLTTEMLRLFHFRYIAANAEEILSAAADPSRQAAYISARHGAFETLKQHIHDPKTALDAAIRLDGPDPFDWLTDRPVSSNAVGQQDLFNAWRALRLEWQLRYCNAKLGHVKTDGAKSPLQREHFFTAVGWGSLAGIAVLHLVHLVWHWELLNTVIVWIALIALAARAVEDGVKPQREVERYKQYRANIHVAAQQFDEALTAAARVQVMRSFERVSTEEMKTFLRTHAEAKYLL